MIIEQENLGVWHIKKCNINYYNNFYLPIVFHNLRGYDGHFIIKKAYEIVKAMDRVPNIHVIPNSYEKFMSFDLGHLKLVILVSLWHHL